MSCSIQWLALDLTCSWFESRSGTALSVYYTVKVKDYTQGLSELKKKKFWSLIYVQLERYTDFPHTTKAQERYQAGSGVVGKYNAESPKQDSKRFNCQVTLCPSGIVNCTASQSCADSSSPCSIHLL